MEVDGMKSDAVAIENTCRIIARTLAVLGLLQAVAVAQPQHKTIGNQQTSNSLQEGHIDSPTGIGGPDAFGYRWIDSDEIGGPPPFPFNDISTFGTQITVMTSGNFDDGYRTEPLPFAFPFYGTSYSAINIGTNGFVNFGTGSTVFANGSIPSVAAPNNAIYAFWDDLDLRFRGKLYFYNDTFTGRFIIQYDSVQRYANGAQNSDTMTFQIILRPNGSIQTHYREMIATVLNSATIGIENAAGTVALQVVNDAAYMHDNLAIQFAPPNSLLTWDGQQIDATWENPNQWDPNIVPTLFDSATVKRGIVSREIQIFNFSNAGVAAIRILDTGVVKFNTFNDGRFVVTRSLRIDSTGSFFLLFRDTISVGQDMNLNGGTLHADTFLTGGQNAIHVGRSWLYRNGSRFVPGTSTVLFTGEGVFSGPFYNIDVADSMSSPGNLAGTVRNIIDSNEVRIRGKIRLQRGDTLFCVRASATSIVDTGKVIAGTIQRAIQSGVSARYRFESDSTYLFFSAGTFPARVNVTTYPDSSIPSQNFVQFTGAVVRNPATNSIRVGGNVNPYKRWAIGIPRFSPNSPPQLVKRVYDITAVGPNDSSAILSLRYDDDELEPGMDESALTLFYLNLAPQLQVSPQVFLDGPFNPATNLMTNSLRSSILPTRFPGKPIPVNAVDSIQVEIRGTINGLRSATVARAARNEVAEDNREKNPRSEANANSHLTQRLDIASVMIGDSEPTSPLVANPKISQPAWLLTDGTIRNFADTTKNYVEFDTTAGNYYVVVRHRNHLAIMSATAQALSNSAQSFYDFRADSTKAFGTGAMKPVGANKYAMWAGDVTGDGVIKYNLAGNDRAPILVRIGGTNINNTVSGYYSEDVNLDGIVKYNLGGNDRAIILINIGGANINATRTTQVP